MWLSASMIDQHLDLRPLSMRTLHQSTEGTIKVRPLSMRTLHQSIRRPCWSYILLKEGLHFHTSLVMFQISNHFLSPNSILSAPDSCTAHQFQFDLAPALFPQTLVLVLQHVITLYYIYHSSISSLIVHAL